MAPGIDLTRGGLDPVSKRRRLREGLMAPGIDLTRRGLDPVSKRRRLRKGPLLPRPARELQAEKTGCRALIRSLYERH